MNKKSRSRLVNEPMEMTELNCSAEGQHSIQKKSSDILNEEIKRRTKRNNQVYKLLISLNITFFVLVTPLVLCNSLMLLKTENIFVVDLVYVLAYFNHCLNFVFYSVSCEMYRIILIQGIKKLLNFFLCGSCRNAN